MSTNWLVIETHEEAYEDTVLQRLRSDPRTNHLDGQWGDLLIRHGEDEGWAVETTCGKTREALEQQRLAADLPATGRAFYLLIKRG